jgi:hypothetical protein
MKNAIMHLLRKSTMSLNPEKAIKKTVTRYFSKTVIEKIDYTVPLPKNSTPLTVHAVKLNEKIEELRVKKDLEEKVKQQEELKRKQFHQALSKKKGAADINKLING